MGGVASCGMAQGTASYVAQLRVYEPLAAFEPAQRERWQDYVAQGLAPSREDALAVEHEACLRALCGLAPPVLPDLPEHALVTVLDGVTLLCPWGTRARASEAALDVRADLPDLVADAFVPRAVAEAAERELDATRVGDPEARTHVLTATWQVPLRWFVLVDPAEREVSAGLPGAGGAPPGQRTGRSLVYRTPMSRARRRVARALAVLRRTLEDGTVTAGVEDLGRWLEEFHPRSLVELDYGGLVHLLDDEALRDDTSAADVAESMAGLADGDGDRASAAYARVTARMKVLQDVERAN